MQQLNAWSQRTLGENISEIIDVKVNWEPCCVVEMRVKQSQRSKIRMIQESFELETPFEWHEDRKVKKKNIQTAKDFLANEFLNRLNETEKELVDDGKGKRTFKRLQFIQAQPQKQQKQKSNARKK